ncbi:type II secretion system F family protein [Krasilnikovia sp. MM14-A1259]|uniref:type II secretion system F family protein n=1 Tax=Krasilnikovia sp. MM14-A1259 TaxID=3373539 RepID=UPI00382E1374
MQPLIFAVTVGAALGGLFLLLTGIVGTTRPAAPASKLRRRVVRLWTGTGLSRAERRTRQLIIVAAVVATAGVWLITGIPVAGLIAGGAVIGVPWLFGAGRVEQRAIARLEALETWTRRLADLVRTGLGLNQAIIVSTRDAPAPLASDLRELETQLRAGVPILTALDRFAAALGDASSDEVIVALRLHATDRGQRLTDILDKLAENTAREVTVRREVWASRADPRLTTKFMTGLGLGVFILLFANPTYMRPYTSLGGQSVLVGCTLAFVALLAWIRKLSTARKAPRLLNANIEVHQ